jgi:hypothetical protein
VNRRAAFLLVLLATAACQRAPEPPPPPPKPAAKTATEEDTQPIAAPTEEIDGDNLLNIAYGASVVSRTAELNLENSAVHAIDGLSYTLWTSSPDGPRQALTFSLGAPSRIERLGVTTNAKDQSPAQLRFEASSDARTWREVATMEPLDRKTKLIDVTPFEARYLRVTTIEPSEYYSSFFSVHAIGRETAPPERRSFDGCWRINTHRAKLVQRGARITGVIDGAKPTFLDGLLVSVRSGAKFSMPGMMDTILNLGLNDETVEGLKRADRQRPLRLDSYRRFIQMFGNVVLEIPKDAFEHEFEASRSARRAKLDTDLDEDGAARGRRALQEGRQEEDRRDFPQDPASSCAGASARCSLVDEPARDRLPPHLRHPRRHGAPPSTCRRWCSATPAIARAPASASRATRPTARRSSTASS